VATLFEALPQLESILLVTDVYGAVFPPDHPLSRKREPMSWTDLQAHKMIGLHPNNGIRALIDRQPNLPAALKRPAYEVSAMPSLLPLLQQGIGYAALPAMAAAPLLAAGMQFKRLGQPALNRQLYVFKKKGRSLSPAANALMRAISDALQKVNEDRNIRVRASWTSLASFAAA
jgi:DNA-binding transcriptional LysR family regulator